MLERELSRFGISFESLIITVPKHSDTRVNAKRLAFKIFSVKEFVDFLNQKLRLPITNISRKFKVTRKVIYKSKDYIITIVVVLEKRLEKINEWI